MPNSRDIKRIRTIVYSTLKEASLTIKILMKKMIRSYPCLSSS